MSSLDALLREAAQDNNFSGVVRVSQAGETIEFAQGMADRSNERPATCRTRFATASATKGLTALTVVSLIEEGALTLDATVPDILGDLLPTVEERVTIDHLLTHRSGIGDYIDEEVLVDIDDHVLGARSAHTLVTAGNYLDLLNAYPQRTLPGQDFAYNNSGYVVLALIVETLTGSFHRAVEDRVLAPAGMGNSGFFRSDDLPADVALGYLEDGRTNVFHLPVIGTGDGGAYMTLDDVDALWHALFNGALVSSASVQAMTTITTERADKPCYGRGFWLDHSADHVWLEGMDAGVSFQSGVHRPSSSRYTIMSNTSSGVWPLARLISDELAG